MELLEGITVVELSTMVAGPCAAKTLADWGAEVIKVEPPDGDLWRHMGQPMGCPAESNCNPVFDMENSGKHFLALDLKRPEGHALLLDLLARADVFITNLRPQALEKLSLDYPQLCALFPRLIYGQVLGYDSDGPLKNAPAYDVTVFWGRTGLIDYLTPPDSPPVNLSAGAMGDHITGMHLVSGIVSALYRRTKTGQGDRVSASLYHAGLHCMGSVIVPAQMVSLKEQRKALQSSGTNGTYRCQDGRYILFSITDVERIFPALCHLTGLEHLLDDTRFNTRRQIYQHQLQFRSYLEQAMLRRTAADWEPLLAQAGIPAQIIFTPAEAGTDPQALNAGFLAHHRYDNGLELNLPYPPVQFNSVTPPPFESCGAIGRDSTTILRALGYTDAEISSFSNQGIVLGRDTASQ